MPKDFGRRTAMSEQMVREISASPAMLAEQGGASQFMQSWGGAQMYRTMAKAPMEARVVYYAVIEGYGSPDQIEVATGLSSKEVSKGVSYLQKKGFIGEMEPEPIK